MIRNRPATIRHVALVSEHAGPYDSLGGPDAGGQNVYVAGLATELARRDIEVTVYTRRQTTDHAPRVRFTENVTVEYVEAGPCKSIPRDGLLPYMQPFGAALQSRWTVNRPDIVHAHYWMSGLACLEAVRALRIPYAQTFHALGSVKQRLLKDQDTSPKERVPSEILLSRVADAVIATSAAEVTELTQMQALRRQISVVPCGVDIKLFSPLGSAEEKPTHRKRIVVIGRLVRRKGVDEVVRALKRLPMAELVIVGGTGNPDPDADRIRALAQAERVTDRVELRGPLPHTQIPRVLRSADLVVCFPWYEPFGMVAIEAMACGRPVLAADVGGLSETLLNGTTGILVPSRDWQKLAKAAAAFLQDENTCSRMAKAARQRAINLYDWRPVVDQMLEVYALAQRNVRNPTSPFVRDIALS
jgi:D-inositol-3-phosphate glycosyltransferase